MLSCKVEFVFEFSLIFCSKIYLKNSFACELSILFLLAVRSCVPQLCSWRCRVFANNSNSQYNSDTERAQVLISRPTCAPHKETIGSDRLTKYLSQIVPSNEILYFHRNHRSLHCLPFHFGFTIVPMLCLFFRFCTCRIQYRDSECDCECVYVYMWCACEWFWESFHPNRI